MVFLTYRTTGGFAGKEEVATVDDEGHLELEASVSGTKLEGKHVLLSTGEISGLKTAARQIGLGKTIDYAPGQAGYDMITHDLTINLAGSQTFIHWGDQADIPRPLRSLAEMLEGFIKRAYGAK